jgi:hypothetical protein
LPIEFEDRKMSLAAKTSGIDRMTLFERAIVFRVARGYFLIMAVAAVLLFVGGVIVGARGLTKVSVPPAVPVAPVAPRALLTYFEVAAEVQRVADATRNGSKSAGTITPASKDSDEPAKVDPALEAASKALRAVFPDPPYSWLDENEQYCAAPTGFGCLQTGTRVKRHGVASEISAALSGVRDDELVDYVNLLARVLRSAPVESRLQLVPATIAIERRGRKQQQKLEAEFKEKQDDATQKYETAVATATAEHDQWRMIGIYGVGGGFSLLIVVSLFLAFLSMERHTRALDRLTSGLAQSASATRRASPNWED